jgi:predicted RND superfamily exporter protein
MEKLGRVIVKLRIPILILGILLVIPSVIGYAKTKVNYDVLYYLPDNIETIKGQDILLDDFHKCAYAVVMVQDMSPHEIEKLSEKIESVDHVAELISFNNLLGDSIPVEILPDKYVSKFYNKDTDTTLMAIFFDDTTSNTDTMDAIV